MVAFFLPLSQCTAKQTNPVTKAIEQKVTDLYVYSGNDKVSVETLTAYAAFLWPVMLTVASLVWPRLNQSLAVGIFELLLCAGSGFELYAITYLGTLRYGAYIAGGAIGLYFIASSVDLFARMRKRLE